MRYTIVENLQQKMELVRHTGITLFQNTQIHSENSIKDEAYSPPGNVSHDINFQKILNTLETYFVEKFLIILAHCVA